jgi:hypothetical protein
MFNFDFLHFLLYLICNLMKIVSLPRASMVGSRQRIDLAHHRPTTAHRPNCSLLPYKMPPPPNSNLPPLPLPLPYPPPSPPPSPKPASLVSLSSPPPGAPSMSSAQSCYPLLSSTLAPHLVEGSRTWGEVQWQWMQRHPSPPRPPSYPPPGEELEARRRRI